MLIMVRINLLPWREQARKIRRIQFAMILGVFLFITLLLLVTTHLYSAALVDTQLQRNAFIQSEIDLNQGRLTTLKTDKNTKMNLEMQLRFVMDLRARGHKAIHLFEALTNAVPASLTLEKIERINNNINLTGKAQSDLQITQFMKNLVNEHKFNQPVLTEISTRKNGEVDERYFKLKVQQQE
jgi:type IV pilus assembly protein PilN